MKGAGTGVISVWKDGLPDDVNWRRTGELLDVLVANGYVARAGTAPRGPCWVVDGIEEDELAHLARSFGERFVLFGGPGALRLLSC